MLTELFQLWADKVTAAKQVSVEEFDRFKDRLVTMWLSRICKPRPA